MTQAGTEVKRTAITNDGGQFNIPSLPPATYHLMVESAGFKRHVQDVTLLADESGSLQIQMQLGASIETVTVEATATLVNTATPVLSQVIKQRQRLDTVPWTSPTFVWSRIVWAGHFCERSADNSGDYCDGSSKRGKISELGKFWVGEEKG
jgi:hypothetical protein